MCLALMLFWGRWEWRKILLIEQNMPLLLPVSENRKMTMLKVLLLAGCAEGKGSIVKALLWFLERNCLKSCLRMPAAHQDFPHVPFYSKIEELQEYRLPSLLFLREPKKAVRRMANLGQTKGPFSPAACLLHAHEQMLREECKKRTNIE